MPNIFEYLSKNYGIGFSPHLLYNKCGEKPMP